MDRSHYCRIIVTAGGLIFDTGSYAGSWAFGIGALLIALTFRPARPPVALAAAGAARS